MLLFKSPKSYSQAPAGYRKAASEEAGGEGEVGVVYYPLVREKYDFIYF
ncbi:hypothetical protein [Halodesulfovibrio aestuarii]